MDFRHAMLVMVGVFGLAAASPALADNIPSTPAAEVSAPAEVEAFSSDEAWEKAIDEGKTDVELLGRREIAPGIFPKREEMRSLARYGCYIGGDVVPNDRRVAAMLAAGQQCTDAFRERVNKVKKAGSTTFSIHIIPMVGYSFRIDKRGSSEQGNTTCDAVSPFGSTAEIAFACFNDMSGHQRVMGFATALGQDVVRGGINLGLMRAQRPNRTIIENGSDSDSRSRSGSAAASVAEVEDGGVVVNNTNVNENNNANANANANNNLNQAGAMSSSKLGIGSDSDDFDPTCPTTTCH